MLVRLMQAFAAGEGLSARDVTRGKARESRQTFGRYVPDCVPFIKDYSEKFMLEQFSLDLVICFRPFLLVQLLPGNPPESLVRRKSVCDLVVTRKTV